VNTQNDLDRSPLAEIGSRRFLTLMFADLCESSRLAALVDAEEFAVVLLRLRQAARAVVARHEGLVARIQGDGVLAFFGHPASGENVSRRAVEAAIDLRDAINSLHVAGMRGAAARIGLHTGIHAGLVFISEGDIERGRFDLVGHTVNTAARLCSIAQDGEICVSESALGPAAEFFVGEVSRDVEIKGQDERLRVRTITGRAQVQRRFEASSSRGLAGFVGRSTAWQRLDAGWQRALQGRPVCMLVTGQPGLGKTRLIEEFARSNILRRGTVLRGFCESYLGAEPLQPFLQMLRAAGTTVVVEGGADGGAHTPAATVARWVAARAAHCPVLMVLDDWQWADDASRQTLDRVLEIEAPLLVLVASRTAAAAAVGARPHEVVDLLPLEHVETRNVVGHWLPLLDPFLMSEIHSYAGGIPLFIEELCHAIAAGGQIHAGVPQSGTAWISALVESRVARLDAEPAELLRVASVLGASFTEALLTRLVGSCPGDPRLAVLAEQDFLFAADQPGLLRFKHGITRDSVYATVGLADRQRLHARVAALLQEAEGGDAAPEVQAYHLSAAGQHGPAAGFAESAGDKAMTANALDRAREQYTSALRDLDALPSLSTNDQTRWCRVAQKLGMACVFDPISIPDRERLLERAVTLALQLEDGNIQARAEYWLGYSRYAVGRAKSGLPHCQRALRLAEASGDVRLAAQVRATLGQALTAVCRYDEALPLLEEAIVTKRRAAAPGGSTAIGSAFALASKGLLLTDRGAFIEARTCFAEARSLLGASAHPVASSVCGLMGIALLWQGAWDEAIAVAEEGARVAEDSRSRQLLAMGRSIAGYARWVSTGDSAGAYAVHEALRWIETRAGRFMISLLYGWQLEAAAAQGDEKSARRLAARLLLRARDGDHIGEAMGCRAMARLAASRGSPVEADAWLARAERAAAMRGSPHEAANNLLGRAALAAAQGDAAAQRSALRQASAAFSRLGMAWHLERTQAASTAAGFTAY
jgi:class 3 adenylate cyclase/tetratricopeptide (TPR) repeat protein